MCTLIQNTLHHNSCCPFTSVIYISSRIVYILTLATSNWFIYAIMLYMSWLGPTPQLLVTEFISPSINSLVSSFSSMQPKAYLCQVEIPATWKQKIYKHSIFLINIFMCPRKTALISSCVVLHNLARMHLDIKIQCFASIFSFRP